MKALRMFPIVGESFLVSPPLICPTSQRGIFVLSPEYAQCVVIGSSLYCDTPSVEYRNLA